jgi:Domain of unknown function (DUF4926)
MEQFDVVALTSDLPEEGLTAGAVGTIVEVFHEPNLAYEVEFSDAAGRTLALATLQADQLRPATAGST